MNQEDTHMTAAASETGAGAAESPPATGEGVAQAEANAAVPQRASRAEHGRIDG